MANIKDTDETEDTEDSEDTEDTEYTELAFEAGPFHLSYIILYWYIF